MTLLSLGSRRRDGAVSPYPTSAPYNVADSFAIPTYDGTNQPVHFDVIDFHAEIGQPWNGYRYWMCHTPYPFLSDSVEDPSIVVSNDAVTWIEPPGLTNPLYRPTTGPYNNDPDMVYDPESDEIVLIYRDFQTLILARSPDGITWPASPTIVTPGVNCNPSPTLLLEQDGSWRMWERERIRTAPVPEGPWTQVSGTLTGLIQPWHINIVHAPAGGYHMMYHSLATGPGGEVQFFTASSANGVAWTTNPTPVLISGTHPWSERTMYRNAFTLHEDGDRYRVWYPGATNAGLWRAGYTEIPLTEWPTP